MSRDSEIGMNSTIKINQPCFHWKWDKGIGQMGEKLWEQVVTDLSVMFRKEDNIFPPTKDFFPSINAK